MRQLEEKETSVDVDGLAKRSGSGKKRQGGQREIKPLV
jgi:hypothetical protein